MRKKIIAVCAIIFLTGLVCLGGWLYLNPNEGTRILKSKGDNNSPETRPTVYHVNSPVVLEWIIGVNPKITLNYVASVTLYYGNVGDVARAGDQFTYALYMPDNFYDTVRNDQLLNCLRVTGGTVKPVYIGSTKGPIDTETLAKDCRGQTTRYFTVTANGKSNIDFIVNPLYNM
jgi:hypothetical protein